MIYRAITLSLVICVGAATILPLATIEAEAGPRTQRRAKKKGKKYKKYSKQWWRAYRQRQNRQKNLNAKKRGWRLRQIRLANARRLDENNSANMNSSAKSNGKMTFAADNSAAMLPSGEAAPVGWKRGATTAGELQYRVDDESGSTIGAAAISIVGPAVGADNDNAVQKTVGGVSTSALRRTVIDRMIKEEGWVVNDYQKQVGDRRVYVVVAQSPGTGGAVQSRLFYFTQVDGRIYSVATNAPKANSQRLEHETEKAINSLQRKPSNVQQAELK